MSNIQSKYIRGDMVIWIVIMILFIVSSLAVYSSTGTLAYKYAGGNTIFYFFRHVRFLFFGIFVVYLFHRIDYSFFSRFSQLMFVLAMLLLLLTLALGVSRNEASRWLTVPVIGIEFQTSDFAKFALIMYIARILAKSQESDEELRIAFKPLITAVMVICGLILPANFSTAFLLFATSFVLMFIGRVDFKLLMKFAGAMVLALIFFITITLSVSDNAGRISTWKHRIQNFTSVKGKSTDANYQVDQAKIAIVTGGFFGKGPGNSTQRNFLPHPYSDFIYAIIIEEYGVIGAVTVMILYLYLLYRTALIVRRCTRTFPAFLAIGLAVNLLFQAMTNMAVAVNLIPVTGQTLPFISMGGTSILFTCVALGIILSISRSVENQQVVESEANTATA